MDSKDSLLLGPALTARKTNGEVSRQAQYGRRIHSKDDADDRCMHIVCILCDFDIL